MVRIDPFLIGIDDHADPLAGKRFFDRLNPGLNGAEAVRDAVVATIMELPAHLRKSLTCDQGAEMAQHAQLRIDTGLEVYFCDPQSPWQRGSNENTWNCYKGGDQLLQFQFVANETVLFANRGTGGKKYAERVNVTLCQQGIANGFATRSPKRL